jgi:hypothetical protein
LSKPTLFIDSDGVFANFDQHVLDLFGKTPNALGDAELWRLANSTENFWSDMPLMPGAREFFDAIKHVNPIVLTGCPKSDYDRAAKAKVAWWKRNFDHDNVITCLSKEKATYMKAEGDWLVDDMTKNCKRWAAAKGYAIRYKGDWEGTINALKLHDVL